MGTPVSTATAMQAPVLLFCRRYVGDGDGMGMGMGMELMKMVCRGKDLLLPTLISVSFRNWSNCDLLLNLSFNPNNLSLYIQDVLKRSTDTQQGKAMVMVMVMVIVLQMGIDLVMVTDIVLVMVMVMVLQMQPGDLRIVFLGTYVKKRLVSSMISLDDGDGVGLFGGVSGTV